jgi:hypothetical protein
VETLSRHSLLVIVGFFMSLHAQAAGTGNESPMQLIPKAAQGASTSPPTYRVTAGASISDNKTYFCSNPERTMFYTAHITTTYSITPATSEVTISVTPNPTDVPASMMGVIQTQTFQATATAVPRRYTINKTVTDSFKHCDPLYVTYTLDVAPKVTGLPLMWWFNNEKPSGYPIKRTLTATPGASSYMWMISGDDQASGSFTAAPSGLQFNKTTTGNTVTIYARKRSLAGKKKLVVTVTANSVTSNPYRMTVQSPNSLSAPIHHDYLSSEAEFANYCQGQCTWLTEVFYELRDQYLAILPHNLPFNEHFTSNPTPQPGTMKTWPRPAVGANPDADPTKITDHIAAPSNTPYMPAPQPYNGTPSTKAVDQWSGELYAGSTTEGAGCRVESLTWKRWVDHGRHDMITSASPALNCP